MIEPSMNVGSPIKVNTVNIDQSNAEIHSDDEQVVKQLDSPRQPE